jgi:hypothetical protein
MYRLFVIARHTFIEAVSQPIYTLVVLIGAALVAILGMLPFFTLGEDTRMFKSVAADVVLLLVLIVTLLTTSRSIYEEIEDRTMLTLMSKPVSRLTVLAGKYLGLIVAAALAVAVLGVAIAICVYYRIPTDYLIPAQSLFADQQKRLADYRLMHIAGIAPGMVLVWLQVSVLAAISVAISTRFSFVVNLPAVVLIYLAGNMTRFIDAAVADRGALMRGFGWVIETVFPFLGAFDRRDLTVFATIKLDGTIFAEAFDGVRMSEVWLATGQAGLYALFYTTAALAAGLLMFRSRELGGGEG